MNKNSNKVLINEDADDGIVLQGQAHITLSCIQLHKKAERIAAVLSEKAKLNSGQHVALLFPPGLDLIAAFYGCLYAGKYYY